MGKLFPYLYDLGMRPLEEGPFYALRKEMIRKVNGRVLEIGSGSGINFPFYRNVERVDAIEPNPAMRKKARSKLEKAAVPIFCHEQKAEQLLFPNQTFDYVISTLVFCTIPNPEAALKEMIRVSKPNAIFYFFEHVKMDNAILGKTQELLTPFWKVICDGCHLNRNTVEIIKEAGLQIREIKYFYKGLFIMVECAI
ncbi:methylase involved in ubiquinone/menaquinone biosynthesis [Mycobacteroides abscessus subsp. abscessus]|nr:methylase involved in ubiquinone/menaquinone biosynthesis [Mycobacteroides abscessus subsp. abscessus]